MRLFFCVLCVSLTFAYSQAFLSCSSVSSSSLADTLTDTVEQGNLMVIAQPPPLIMDQLDSLKKNLVYFPLLDSINKIDPKVAKKNRRDSLLKELKKKPKHIYLTFDDGPLIGSAAIDSIATAKGIKISVFLVGRHAAMNKRLKRDLERYKSNILVASYNHSYTHGNQRYQRFYSDPISAVADFEKAQEEMGLKDKIIRLPGRNIWVTDEFRRFDGQSGRKTAEMLYDKGYKIYGWDVEWRMNGATAAPVESVSTTYRSIKSYLNNHYTLYANNAVLLMHDDMFQTRKGQKLLGDLIDSLKQHEDYRFEFMADYPIKY